MLNISFKETSAHRDARVLTYRKTQSTRVSQKLLCLLCASVYPDEEPMAPHPSPRESAGVITQVAGGSWRPQAPPHCDIEQHVQSRSQMSRLLPERDVLEMFPSSGTELTSLPAPSSLAWAPLPLCSDPKPTEDRGTPFSSLPPSPHHTPPVQFPGLTSCQVQLSGRSEITLANPSRQQEKQGRCSGWYPTNTEWVRWRPSVRSLQRMKAHPASPHPP